MLWDSVTFSGSFFWRTRRQEHSFGKIRWQGAFLLLNAPSNYLWERYCSRNQATLRRLAVLDGAFRSPKYLLGARICPCCRCVHGIRIPEPKSQGCEVKILRRIVDRGNVAPPQVRQIHDNGRSLGSPRP